MSRNGRKRRTSARLRVYHFARGLAAVGHTPARTFCGIPIARARLAHVYAGAPGFAPCRTCLARMVAP